MNLVESLLKADASKAKEYDEGTFKSYRLAKILEQDDPVEIKIREVEVNTFKNIQQFMTKKDGSMDRNKLFDSNLMMCAEGIVDPNLKDENLQKQFGATNARELAEILFRLEAPEIADAISNLSLNKHKDDEANIKN